MPIRLKKHICSEYCGCEHAVSCDIVEVEPVAKERKRLTLSGLRKIVSDYSSNPEKFATGEKEIVTEYGETYIRQKVRPLLEILQEAGVEYLASGHYSDTYDLGDGKRIIKVQKRNDDDAYDAYARHCAKTPTKLQPKIYYQGEWGGNRVYIIEKLYGDETKAKSIAQIMRTIADMSRSNYDRYDMSVIFPMIDKKYRAGIETLAAFFKNCGHCIDLHGDNIMFRANGEFVITDPIS